MRQKIATRIQPTPSLLALGLDEPGSSDWEDQHTVITHSPSLTPPNDSAYSTKHSSTRYHTVFSEDEDEAGPSISSASKLSSLFPSSMRSSQQPTGFMDPMLTSPAYHIHQADNALSTLKQVVYDDGWKKALKHKSGVIVYMKHGVNKADKTPIFKGQTVIHGFSPQSIFYVIGMRRLWDESYEDGNLVENLNDTTSLTYEVNKATATSKARDLALIEKIECTQDGAIIFACTSVESFRIPRVPGRTRAQIRLQGWILEPIRGPTPATQVTYVIQENMKGWVPGFAKKSLARRPLVIAAVNDYLQKKADRLKNQNKSSHHTSRPSVFGPTLDPRSSKATAAQSSAASSIRSLELSSAAPSPISSHRSLNVEAAPTTPTSTKKRITFADKDLTYPAEERRSSESTLRGESKSSNLVPATSSPTPTPTPTRHLYPSHRHPKKKMESLELLKRLSSSLEGWVIKGEKDGVKMYTLTETDKAPFLRGECTVEGGWTPEQLCSVIHCFGARKVWDERFEDGRVQERFSQKEYLVQWWLRNMFPVSSCDLSAVTTIESDPSSGAVYTASISVNDPLIPVDESGKRVRGHTDLYGWVFTPNTDERGRTRSVNVIMVCNMDYRCRVPASAAKVLGDEMLGCVGNVRDYVFQYGCPPYIRRVAGKVVEEDFETKTGTYQVTYVAKHEPSHAYRTRKSGWCTDIRFHKSVYPQGLDVKVSPSQGTRVEMSAENRSIRVYTTSSEMEGKRVVILLTTEHRSTRQPKATAVSDDTKLVHHRTSSSRDQKTASLDSGEASPTCSEVSELAVRRAEATAAASVPKLAHAVAATMVTPVETSTASTAKLAVKPVAESHPKPEPVQTAPAQALPLSSSLFKHPLHPLNPATVSSTAPTVDAIPLSPASSHVSSTSNNLQVPKGYMLVPQNYQNNNIIIISDELTFNGQQLAVVFIAMVICYYMGKFACAC
ncbi:hypothetical protein BX666DRAFT_1901516 [Dichotomocladium elegans]|nr:hypothetical protein BX666DRAFT_1901516 [Dichotomocladium elegans]